MKEAAFLQGERTKFPVRSKETQHNGFHRASRPSLAEDEYMKTGDKTRKLDKYNKRCVFEKNLRRKMGNKAVDTLKKNATTLNCPANKDQNRSPLRQ